MTAYLLETSPWNPVTSSVESVNFASGLTDDGALGTPKPYLLRLRNSFSHEISVFPDNQPGGGQVSIGSVVLNNTDGSLDYLLDYNWSGRNVVFKSGPEKGTYANFTTIFTGSVIDISHDRANITLSLRDNSWKLVEPLQKNKYKGTGNAEGGRELQNKRKPLSFGLCKNVTPVVISTSQLLFQVHDGAILGIDAVFDDAVTLAFGGDQPDYLALTTAPVARGAYLTCNSLGLIRLGAPAEGALTMDVRGFAYNDVSVARSIKSILLARSKLVGADFLDSDINELHADLPGRMSGVYFQEPDIDLDEFLETILGMANAFWFFSASGKLRIRQFKFRTPSAFLDGGLVKAVQRQVSAKPIYSIAVNYDRNLTVQDVTSLSIASNTLNSYFEEEIINVQTAANGTGGDYTAIEDQMLMILGDTEANLLRVGDFVEVTPKDWVSIDPDGKLEFSEVSQNSDTATLRVSLNDHYVTEDLTIRKILGPNGQWMRLAADRRVLHLDALGVAVDPSESAIITAQGNYTGTLAWSAVDNLGREVNLPGSGNFRTLYAGSPASNPMLSSVRVRVTDENGLFATVKIVYGRREATLLDLALPWDQVTDPTNTKPDDNATNSADPNSPFGPGGKKVGDILDDLHFKDLEFDVHNLNIFNLAKTAGTINAYLQARTTLDGEPIGTVVVEARTILDSTVEDFRLIGAKNSAGTAFVLDLDTVMVDEKTSLAQSFYQQAVESASGDRATVTNLAKAITGLEYGSSALALESVDATMGGEQGIRASVSFLKQAVVTPEGDAVAKAVLSLDVNGRVAGFTATNDGTQSSFYIVADEFGFVDPSDDGTTGTKPFYYLDGILYLDYVKVRKLDVGVVTTSNIGFNEVTGKTFFQFDYAGAGGADLGASSSKTWAAFGTSTTKAKVSTQGTSVPVGTEVNLRMLVNMQRTGDDTDRVWFRIRRTGGTAGDLILGDIVKSGMSNYPNVCPWEWQDKITEEGSYTYNLEYYRDTGGGKYYTVKLVCDVGRR